MRNNRKNKILRVIGITAAALTVCAGAVVIFLKRKDIKRRFNIFTLTIAVILCGMMMCGLTAYAAELDAEPDKDTATEVITGEETEIDINDFIDPDRQPNQLTPPVI